MSKLSGGDPSEIFDQSKLGDKDSVLGSIVSKVGSQLQSKLANGEIRQEDLMRDAMAMLQHMNVGGAGGGGAGGMGGFMETMMKAAGAGIGKSRSGTGARDKLRAKHARRAAAAADAAAKPL
jgi:hypothetical protein